jgi:hypothetical protein
LDEPKGIFFPEVPPAVAQRIYDRHGVNPTPEQRASGFWPCVYWYPQIEVHITEGKKKAEADCSQGYACIGLPSASGGYRAKDSNGEYLDKRVLHDELEVFATLGRSVVMIRDQDTNPQTVKNVRRDFVRTGELFEEAGAKVKFTAWDSKLGKGCDDYIVKNGPRAWRDRIDNAAPLTWESEAHYSNEYGKLRGWITKRYGEAGSQEKFDTAIAYFCREQDIEKVIAHSPAVKYASTLEVKAYAMHIRESAIVFREKLDQETKQRVKIRG